jgi:cytochrome c-type biogenesis protein CcmH/NrfF
LKFVPSLFALDSYSIATWLYPATLVVVNGFVAALLVSRRRHLRRKQMGDSGTQRLT